MVFLKPTENATHPFVGVLIMGATGSLGLLGLAVLSLVTGGGGIVGSLLALMFVAALFTILAGAGFVAVLDEVRKH